jgi:hypothetical protein
MILAYEFGSIVPSTFENENIFVLSVKNWKEVG